MFLSLTVIFVILWLAGWLLFHVGGAAIHIFAVVAFISCVLHFTRGKLSIS